MSPRTFSERLSACQDFSLARNVGKAEHRLPTVLPLMIYASPSDNSSYIETPVTNSSTLTGTSTDIPYSAIFDTIHAQHEY